MPESTAVEQVTAKQLNGRMNPRYLRSLKPEIEKAISREYPHTAIYIKTTRIASQIMENPDEYEILGQAESRNLKIIISRHCSEIAKYKPYSSGRGVSCGRLFVRTPPSETQRGHELVSA